MGANYSVQLSASGGTPPFTYQATGLPAGLNLSVDTIVGQCTASSTNVTLSAIDNYGVKPVPVMVTAVPPARAARPPG